MSSCTSMYSRQILSEIVLFVKPISLTKYLFSSKVLARHTAHLTSASQHWRKTVIEFRDIKINALIWCTNNNHTFEEGILGPGKIIEVTKNSFKVLFFDNFEVKIIALHTIRSQIDNDLSYIELCNEEKLTRYILNQRTQLENGLEKARLAHIKAESNLEQFNRNILLTLGKKRES
jgi:hypothetical protein